MVLNIAMELTSIQRVGYMRLNLGTVQGSSLDGRFYWGLLACPVQIFAHTWRSFQENTMVTLTI